MPWGADSKIYSFEGGNNSRGLWATQGFMWGSGRGGWEAESTHLNTHLPLEEQQVESVVALQGKKDPRVAQTLL